MSRRRPADQRFGRLHRCLLHVREPARQHSAVPAAGWLECVSGDGNCSQPATATSDLRRTAPGRDAAGREAPEDAEVQGIHLAEL